MTEFISKDQTYQIIGLCMEVYRELGYGFSEIVYKDAIEYEIGLNEIPFEREKKYVVNYKGKELRHQYFADFVMFDEIIVEIKASRNGIIDEYISQTLNYLKISGCSIGLIINFGKRVLNISDLYFNLW